MNRGLIYIPNTNITSQNIASIIQFLTSKPLSQQLIYNDFEL